MSVPQTLDNSDIVNLTVAGLDPGIIIGAIVACPKVTFATDTAGLIELAKAKVSTEVIKAMQTKQAAQP